MCGGAQMCKYVSAVYICADFEFNMVTALGKKLSLSLFVLARMDLKRLPGHANA